MRALARCVACEDDAVAEPFRAVFSSTPSLDATMTAPIWILGATGRTGSAVARDLHARGLPVTLVGRDRARLVSLGIAGAEIVAAADVRAMIAALANARASVVVNTVGPFGAQAIAIARACPPGTHYVDVANDAVGCAALLAERVPTGSAWVTGAGFGFVATESIVAHLCRDRPPAATVRVTSVPYIATADNELVGEALAATILDALALGGRRYIGGELVRARFGAALETLTLPDRSVVTSGAAPVGDVVGAHRASRAPDAIATSGELPTGAAVRIAVPVIATLLELRPLRRFATRRIAAIRVPTPKHGRTSSYAHARVTWRDGTVREGWFSCGEAMAFTAASTGEVAARMATQSPPSGAYTPCELYGPELALACGATLQPHRASQVARPM